MVKGIKNFLNGLAFGITETIPGVSGGTIAIILGFYDELIKTVNHFTKDIKKSIRFLAPLLLGMATGLFLFSSIITFLLANYSFPTMTFFIGLIVGIIPVIYSKVKEPGRAFGIKKILLIVIPIILLIVISKLGGTPIADHAETVANIDIPFMAFIFFSGIIAAAALVIPGVSGSFVLLLFGVYPLITYSVSSIRFWLADIANIALMISFCKVLVPLGVGVVIGGLSTARLVEKLLNSYYITVYSVILGLLTGSVYVLFTEPIVYQSGISAPIIALGMLTLTGGFALSFNLGKSRFNV